MSSYPSHIFAFLTGWLLFASVGCQSDTTAEKGADTGAVEMNTGDPSNCSPGRRLDPVTGECRTVSSNDEGTSARDTGLEADSDASGRDTAAMADTSEMSRDGGDEREDSGPGDRRDGRSNREDVRRRDTTPDPRPDGTGDDASGTNPPDGGASCPDRDRDGFRDEACGGRDCNDQNPRVHPGVDERCSQVDEDCDGQNNENLQCRFFAHNQNQVYRINPFQQSTQPLSVSNSPDTSMFDMDTHPNGALYVITQAAKIWKYDPNKGSKWKEVGATGISDTPANGLAINSSGTAFVTAKRGMYRVNLKTAKATELSNLGRFRSSGDCVVTEGDRLLMTALNPLGGDHLVQVDQQSGQPQKLGTLGHSNVWGLTAAWGNLYGMTKGGKLITISQQGSFTVTTFSGPSWYGAASTPASRRSSSP